MKYDIAVLLMNGTWFKHENAMYSFNDDFLIVKLADDRAYYNLKTVLTIQAKVYSSVSI